MPYAFASKMNGADRVRAYFDFVEKRIFSVPDFTTYNLTFLFFSNILRQFERNS